MANNSNLLQASVLVPASHVRYLSLRQDGRQRETESSVLPCKQHPTLDVRHRDECKSREFMIRGVRLDLYQVIIASRTRLDEP